MTANLPETISASTIATVSERFTLFQTAHQNIRGKQRVTANGSDRHCTLNSFETHTIARGPADGPSAEDGELPGVSHAARDHHGDADARGGGRDLRAGGRRLRRFTPRDLAPPERKRGAPTETPAHRVYRCSAGLL